MKCEAMTARPASSAGDLPPAAAPILRQSMPLPPGGITPTVDDRAAASPTSSSQKRTHSGSGPPGASGPSVDSVPSYAVKGDRDSDRGLAPLVPLVPFVPFVPLTAPPSEPRPPCTGGAAGLSERGDGRPSGPAGATRSITNS
jgi:hypothetical protein